MVATALGLDKERGDNISVTSMPFMDNAEEELVAEGMPQNLLYEYLPLLKIGLLSVGVLLFYFFLVRPIIKTMKGEVTSHNKTIAELEKEELERERAAFEAEKQLEEPEEEDIVPDSILLMRQKVMQNQVPTAYIIKKWINEG